MGEDMSHAPMINELDLEENPERKFEFTREVLLKFKVEQEKRQAQERLAKAGNQGFGDFGGGNKESAAPAESASDKLSFVLLATISLLTFADILRRTQLLLSSQNRIG